MCPSTHRGSSRETGEKTCIPRRRSTMFLSPGHDQSSQEQYLPIRRMRLLRIVYLGAAFLPRMAESPIVPKAGSGVAQDSHIAPEAKERGGREKCVQVLLFVSVASSHTHRVETEEGLQIRTGALSAG